MDMYGVLFVGVFVFLGACFGSFACCQAWRIRYKEEKKKDLGKRSVCLHCGKQLVWYENIPIVSWILQKGKCRKCGKRIGTAEIWSELAGAFVFGFLGWNLWRVGEFDWLSVVKFTTLLITVVGFLILGIYDAKWQELPTFLLWFVIICGAAYGCLGILGIIIGDGGEGISLAGKGSELLNYLLNIGMSVGILGGIYYLLYFFSKEKLVGGGDSMLGVAIGLVVGNWWLAIWVLFIANFVGVIVMLPLKKKQIAFGPFLIGAFVLVFSFAKELMLLSF